MGGAEKNGSRREKRKNEGESCEMIYATRRPRSNLRQGINDERERETKREGEREIQKREKERVLIKCRKMCIKETTQQDKKEQLLEGVKNGDGAPAGSEMPQEEP